MFACDQCEKKYNVAASLKKHRTRKHSEITSLTPKGRPPKPRLCGICSARVVDDIELCTHLTLEHNHVCEILNLEFDSVQNFDQWRAEQAHGTFDWTFVWSSRAGGKMYKRYVCHRSGSYESKADGARAPKFGKTIKVDFDCTTFANAVIDEDKGTVKVTACVDHYGHDTDKGKTRVREDQKEFVAAKLKTGLTVPQVVTQLHDDPSPRKQIMTSKTVRNIEKMKGVRQYVRAELDPQSVNIRVKESWETDGEKSPFFAYEPLKEDGSFSLGIQTPYQREMLLKFGHRLGAMDATHCTTQYKYKLITYVVVDDFDRCVPVAQYIALSEDQSALEKFLRGIKERVGDIKPEFFMTDMANQFWNAFCAVFGARNTKRQWCLYHVKQCWLTRLNTISNKELRKKVWRWLNKMVRARTESKFKKISGKILTNLSQKKEDAFVNYLKEKYLAEGKPELYAAYARDGQHLTKCNMFLESWFGTFKNNELKKLQNRRMDFLLEKLLENAKAACITYCILCEHPTVDGVSRKRELHHRHRKAIEMRQQEIKTDLIEEGSKWRVYSQSDPNKSYIVELQNVVCNCRLKCQYCYVCPEMYSCECEDRFQMGRAVACKHMHLIHENYNKPEPAVVSLDPQPPLPVPRREELDQVAFRSKEDHLVALRANTVTKLQELISFTEKSSDPEFLKSVLNRANQLSIKALEQSQQFPVAMQVHGPQKIIHQQPTFKRRTKRTSRFNYYLDAVGIQEADDILLHTIEDYCAKCLQKDDYEEEEDVDWTQCDNESCDLWYHYACIKQQLATCTDNQFFCQICTPGGQFDFPAPNGGDRDDDLLDEDDDRPGFSGNQAPPLLTKPRPYMRGSKRQDECQEIGAKKKRYNS